jgi:hypothetical protein
VTRLDRTEGVPRLVAVAVVLVVVGAAGVAALWTGVGPAPGGDSGEEVTDFPTATPASGSSSGGATADTPEPRPAFAFAVDGTERCGRTCRDVTSTLRNEGDARATGTTVYTRIYVGQEASGDVVWAGTESVGRLDASATYTATTRVELSLSAAAAVEAAGGWITVQTTVETDQRTVTFAEPRRVG